MSVEWKKSPFFCIFMIYKSLRFNIHYFPLKQALQFPVLISPNVILKYLKGTVQLQGSVKFGQIKIGFGDIAVFDRVRSKAMWSVQGKVIFRGNANIGHSVRISVQKSGILTFGKDIVINAETIIVCRKSIMFGANDLISWQCMITDTDIHSIHENGERINADRPVILGDRVWVGSRVNILKGTDIANGCVIGAGSTVTGKLDTENSIYVGTPPKVVKNNITWIQ